MKDGERRLLGYCGVDSGQLIITDPCYLKEWQDGEAYPGLENEHGSEWHEAIKRRQKEYEKGNYAPANSYEGACLATCLDIRGGECFGGLGVATSTGYGDGSYPVIAEYLDGRVARIIIEFISDEEEDETVY